MTPTVTDPVRTDPSAPTDPAAREPAVAPRPRLQLTGTQVLASALAATTATVGASYLGVAGTVIGAALASVLTVVGNAVYSHSLQRTGVRVRTAVPGAARWSPRPAAPQPNAPAPARTDSNRRGTWRLLAASCVGVFAGVLLVVTGVELVAGKPLSDLVRGDSTSGTTVFGDPQARGASGTDPTTTVTVTPQVVVTTPTVTVTGTPVTETASPTGTPTSTPAPSDSSAPSSPSATPSPSSSP